jgi:DNA polymerase-3 subunit gamma/tau
MVLAACGEQTDLVDLSGDWRAQATQQAARFDPAGLVHMIALVESVAARAKLSSFPRALVDAAIVRLAMTEKLADVTALALATPASTTATAPGAPRPKKP